MNRRLADTAKRLWQLTVTKVVTAIAAVFLLWLAVMFIATPRPLFGNNYATVVVAADGSLLGARLAPDEQWRFPPIDTTPDKLATCLYKSAKRYLPGKRLRTDYSDGDPDFEAPFYILKYTYCAAVLTENGFMDNQLSLEFLESEEGKKAIVALHVEGIIEYITSNPVK
jgi:hypothetical protein